MRNTPSSIWLVITVVALFAWPRGALAQDKDTPQITEINISEAKEEPAPAKISMRPNTPINLGFELKNKTADTLREVTVKLVHVVGDEERVIAEGKVKEIQPTLGTASGERVLLFDKVKGPVDEKNKDEKNKDSADKVELKGPPFKFQLNIEVKQPKDFPVVKRKLELIVREPREYLGASANFDQLNKRLRVAVTYPKQEDLFGPHKFLAQLSLSPELKVGKTKVFKDTITSPQQPGDLRADFDELTGEGEAYLKLDGYDRAYVYPVKLAASGAINARTRDEIRVRIVAPRYAKPSEKFEVVLEADGPLNEDYRIKIDMDRTGERLRFRDVIDKAGLREQRAWLSVSATKNLVCQTDVNDWRVYFDTREVAGNIDFRVNVWKFDAKTKDYEKVKLTFPEGDRPKMALNERDEDSKNLFARVSQDESKPEDAQFVKLPKEWPANVPLEVRVKIRERTATQAPIAKVVFFRGKLAKDAKAEIKEEDIFSTVEPTDPMGSEWSFILPPQIKTEPVTISAQLTTRTGIKETISETIVMIPGGAGKALYKIKGTVLHGELAQQKMPVTLTDEKGKEKAVPTKTDDKGTFIFEDLPPGVYIVASTLSARNLVGTLKVE